ncbi:MAG: hypothetical protein J7L82_04160 [Staphylothermus sp.]|nr:hypothetical protein [Staphylothermus sp.]
MEYLILKSMIEGTHLAIYSTIKPGGYHRLMIEPGIDHLLSNTISATDHIIEAIEVGEKIRKGELAATSFNLGQLLARSLREAYRWLPHRVEPSFIIPQIIYSLAISHSDIDSVVNDAGKLKKSLELFLSKRNWREIKYFLESLKSIHRTDMYDHIISAGGISHIMGIEGEISFNDIFRVLGSKWPAFTSLDLREFSIVEYVKKLMEHYRKYQNANNAVIALYLEIIYPKLPSWAKELVDEAIREGLMTGKAGSKKLFELDLKLRKQNVLFHEYTGLLAIITSLAVYEGLRP